MKKHQPYVTALDGRNALELILAIYKSSAEKESSNYIGGRIIH